jgi:hypothetical protein
MDASGIRTGNTQDLDFRRAILAHTQAQRLSTNCGGRRANLTEYLRRTNDQANRAMKVLDVLEILHTKLRELVEEFGGSPLELGSACSCCFISFITFSPPDFTLCTNFQFATALRTTKGPRTIVQSNDEEHKLTF